MHEPNEVRAANPKGSRPDAELTLTHLDSLPTLSAVAVRLLEITSDADTAARDVVELLRGDQSLTAKVLSVAGSAWAGTTVPVTSLEKAVPLLGFSAIRSIALSVSVFECFPAAESGAGGGGAFQRSEFWKHALAVACAARTLAAQLRDPQVEPQDAFVAGLLHDIGKVALSAVFPKAYDRVATQVNQARGDIADFERAILGVDHTVAGRRLAERWRLPREFQETIWLHHLSSETLPASVQKARLIGTVQLADTLAREQRIGYSGNHMFYENSPRGAERLNLSADQIGSLVSRLARDVAEHAEPLGLDREAPDALYVQAMARANAELGRLNTQLMLNTRRLTAGARYFKAIGQFDRQLDAWSDPPTVIAAMTRAAAIALQRSRIAAFGLRDSSSAIDICWVDDETGQGGGLSQAVSDEMTEWLRDPGECLSSLLARTPAPVKTLLIGAAGEWGRGSPWLVPVAHDGKIIAGIMYWSESDERARLADEKEDLTCFVASLSLALGRANAQSAARRLSDELAEMNRRAQQMQAELLRSRTLSKIAEMAAGAGHELNGPLTVISGRAQLLAQTVDSPEAKRSLDQIREKAHECSRLVSELMDFARPRSPRLGTVGLVDLLTELRSEWIKELKLPSARLQLEIPSPTSKDDLAALEISADCEQLRVVFKELLANAVDAVAGNEGVITISCRPAVTRGLVEVTVRDTGCGMQPSVLQRAFDPFYSHRQAGRGRGLGLPRAYRVVESHGGRIWLESAPGEGTTAHVLLPRSPATQRNTSEPEAQARD